MGGETEGVMGCRIGQFNIPPIIILFPTTFLSEPGGLPQDIFHHADA